MGMGMAGSILAPTLFVLKLPGKIAIRQRLLHKRGISQMQNVRYED
jgi:hypothetical protein